MLQHRRAVRSYSKTDRIDSEKVKECLQLAQLAPTSSNLQLREAYHITNPKVIAQIGEACFSQRSATTAQEIVVFITRQDLYKQRAKAVFDFNLEEIQNNAPKDRIPARTKKLQDYYQKLIPFLYSRCFGILGCFRKGVSRIKGFSKPTLREVYESDMQTVVHKSCALVAQTFMLAMSEQNYDTCPLEGFDSQRIKKILNLPQGAEVSLVVACWVRAEDGVQGKRFRIPFEEQYKRV